MYIKNFLLIKYAFAAYKSIFSELVLYIYSLWYFYIHTVNICLSVNFLYSKGFPVPQSRYFMKSLDFCTELFCGIQDTVNVIASSFMAECTLYFFLH